MSLTSEALQTSQLASEQVRQISYRTRGSQHGPITRLFSPGDLGNRLKPFVFLDLIDLVAGTEGLFGFHPHSGIATITTVFEGDTLYEDSTGKAGMLKADGVEWMQAGAGVWHTANPAAPGPVRGYQLWLALPDRLEGAEPHSEYLAPGDVPQVGPARVILGSYGGVKSPLPLTSPLTYLHLRLCHGESFSFFPDASHEVAWLAVDQGVLEIGHSRLSRELAVFEEGHQPITLHACGDANVVIGSASLHPHPLVTGNYSVHTSAAALETGEAGIRAVARRLKSAGKI